MFSCSLCIGGGGASSDHSGASSDHRARCRQPQLYVSYLQWLHIIKFKTPASQYWSVLVHVLHCSYDMQRKPRLGQILTRTGWLKVLSAGVTHQMMDWQGFSKCVRCSHHKQKNTRCTWMWTAHVRLELTFERVTSGCHASLQNGVVP